ncbi:hypothetical protein AB1E18_010634 [Capra hircus]
MGLGLDQASAWLRERRQKQPHTPEGRSASRFGPSRLPPSARSRAPAHVTGAPVIPPLPLRLPPACAALNVSSVRDHSRRRRPGLRTGRTPDSAVTRLPDRRVLLPPLDR